MWAHIGTVECWFSISDTCLRSHGKPTRLFFQSSIQGFPGGLFSLQKQMCVKQRYACYLYRRCKSKHLRSRREILFKGCKKTQKCHFLFPFFFSTSRRSCPFTYSYPLRVSICSRWCDRLIGLYPPKHALVTARTRKHTRQHFRFNLLHVLLDSTLHLHPFCSHLISISPPWIPPHHNPPHEPHVPLPAAAARH